MARLNDLLHQLVAARADSLQFIPEQPPTLFLNGEPRIADRVPLSPAMVEALVRQMLDADGINMLRSQGQFDGLHVSARCGEFTYRVRQTAVGLAVAFRPAERPPTPLEAQSSAARSLHTTIRRSEAETTAVGAAPNGDEPMSVDAGADDAGEQQSPTTAAVPPWPTDSPHELLRVAVSRHASDILFSSSVNTRVRLAGEYVPIEGAVFDDDAILAAVDGVLTPERRQALAVAGSVDLAVEIPAPAGPIRFRVNIFHQFAGLAAAWRPIWDEVPSLDALHLPREIYSLGEYSHGLVLITGPTGSGKSTTLSTIVEHINAHQRRHVITLEDPIEYLFQRKQSIIHQREVGRHVATFSDGIRSALRESPDVILVGEMRDLDTIATALTAAETGHLVLSTVHSGSAAQAVDRIIDVFPEHQQGQIRIQLSDTLRAILTQRLLPRADGTGRAPAIELVKVNVAFANLIRDRRTHQFMGQIQSMRREGMIPFDVSLAKLTNDGLISRDTAIRAARDPKHLETLLV